MIKIGLLEKNPLSLQPLLAEELGLFKKYNLDVEIKKIGHFPAFAMETVTAQVGDTTRIFERLNQGEDLVITSDLTRTMKLILRSDVDKSKRLKILAAETQSLGIYTEYYLKKNGYQFEFISELSMQKRVEMIRTKSVDGACMIDPFLIEFIGHGYDLVYEGKEYPNNFTCWAFHREYIDMYGEQNVLNFHKALNEAGEHYNCLSPLAKVNAVKKHLTYNDGLKTFYENFEFQCDGEYQVEALNECYLWKCQKNPELKGQDLSEVILKWNKEN